MNIVSKHSSADEMVIYRALSVSERNAVIAYYAEENATTDQRDTAIDVVSDVKQQKSWIQCDCRHDQVALLFPRLTHKGVVTLVRPCPVRQIAHADTCLFYLPENKSMSGQRGSKLYETNYCLLAIEKPTSVKSVEKATISYEASEKVESALSGVFLRLLEQADCLRLSNQHYPSFKHIAVNIKQVAFTQPLWGNAPFTLSNVLLTDVKKRIPFFYRLRDEQRFDPDHRKQGYLLVQVQEVKGDKLLCADGTELDVSGTIDIQGYKDSHAFIALILCAESRQGNGFFVCYRASLVSVYSEKMPFIITSQLHRLLLKKLIAWRQYWRTKDYDFELYYPFSSSQSIGLHNNMVVSDLETGKEVTISTDKHTAETLYFDAEQPVKEFNVTVSKRLWASE